MDEEQKRYGPPTLPMHPLIDENAIEREENSPYINSNQNQAMDYKIITQIIIY